MAAFYVLMGGLGARGFPRALESESKTRPLAQCHSASVSYGSCPIRLSLGVRMFIFHRSRRQPVEIFDILIHEGQLPDAEERFGPALRWGRREERFHEVGNAILIHDEMQTEYFLMAKE